MAHDKDHNNPIRPVCRRFPTSQEIWDATNLPFACVLTPLAPHGTATTTIPRSLASIPKCLECGAPHATSETHFRLKSSDALLCYFCGKTSPTDLYKQRERRHYEDGFDVHSQDVQEEKGKKQHNQQHDNDDKNPCLFQLPLRLSNLSNASTTSTTAYSLPALACPPLWFVVLDGTCTNASYWRATSQVLQAVLRDIPDYLHVALLLAGSMPSNDNDTGTVSETTPTLSIFQLSSPVPYLRHYTALDTRNDLLEAISTSWSDGMHRSHLHTAVRSLLDYSSGFNVQDHHDGISYSNTRTAQDDGIPLAWCLELILETLESYGQVAGHRPQNRDHEPMPSPKRPYAGAKMTCLLSQRPSGICQERRKSNGSWLTLGQPEPTEQFTPRIGKGGFGGRITPDGWSQQHGSKNYDEQNVIATADWTPSQLEAIYQTVPDVALYMDELGRQCAQAAVGVDLLFLLDGDENDNSIPPPDLALPIYGHLSTKSGAPGPVLFNVNDLTSTNRLEREMNSRVPWRDGLVFGADLKVRLPPGFGVDTAAVEPSDTKGPQLAPLWVDSGLMGPASSVDGDSKHLWRMGTCDPYTSLTIDLCLKTNTPPRELTVDELGTVAVKPVIQTCFAYTVIEKDESGTYMVKRQMRIHSSPVPFTNETEILYNSLDMEALTMVLFHKVAIASFQDGLVDGLGIAQDWLISTLVAVYKSADDYFERVSSSPRTNGNGASDFEFLSHERLLDQEGELSADEVLLAQGHPLLRRLALVTYQLLQCEAFRTPQGNFSPSPDLRYAALAQMASMSAPLLHRCIGPLVQAWISAEDANEPIVDSVELRRKSIRMTVEEFSKYDDVIFFLDSPSTVAVLVGSIIDDEPAPNASPLISSKGLRDAMRQASVSYRAMPDVISHLEGNSRTLDTIDLLADICIRDLKSPFGHSNFTKWKKDVAARVLDELEK